MKNRIADLEKLLRESAQKFGITLKEKTLLPYLDEQGTQHYIIPDLLYDENGVKIAIEIGGEYSDREKNGQHSFKEEILKKMGYTVVSLDIEKGHEDQVGAFVDELRWLILERKGAEKTALPEYLTSSFSLKDKLQEKIRQRKLEEEKPAAPESQKENAALKVAVEEVPPLPAVAPKPEPEISVSDLMNGKKLEPSPSEKPNSLQYSSKHSQKFPLVLSGLAGSVLAFLLFGFIHFQGVPTNSAEIQQFSADLLGVAAIEPAIAELPSANGQSHVVLTNNAGAITKRKISVDLPAHSALVEYKGMYFVVCTAGFQKSADGKRCDPSETPQR